MRGSTRKRGSTWWAYWDLLPDPQTGKRRQKAKGGFTTRKAAQAHLANVIVDVNDGGYVEPSKTPLATFMRDEWLPAIRGQLRPSTAYTYERIVRVQIERRDIGTIPLRALSPGHVNGWLGELEAANLSAATRRLAFAVLRRAIGDAMRWDRVRRNVAAAADPPAVPATRVHAWTAAELRRFLDRVRYDRLYGLWRLDGTTGMRRGELLGLTWQELDLDARRLRVTQQLLPRQARCDACGHKHASFGPPKSRRSERTVALDHGTVDALRSHQDAQLVERDRAGAAYRDHDLVFADEIGAPIDPRRLSEAFVHHRKAAKIPTGSLHVLRHTAATLALTASPPVPLHVVAARLGDDPKVVLSTYSHVLPHSDELAAEAVAAQLVDSSLTQGAESPALEPLAAA